MPTLKVVSPLNLGPEFKLGTELATKITIGVQAPLKKNAAGDLQLDTAALFASTTNTLALAGALLTNTTNGIPAVQDLTAAIKAAETVCSLNYVDATGVLTFVDEKGVSKFIDLPMESVFKTVAFNSATKQMTFTLVSGATSVVDLATIVSTYALTAGNGIDVTGNGSTATPWVVAAKVDPIAGNPLSVTAAGLKVTLPAAAATTNTLASAVNTMTNTTNGISATAPIVNSNTFVVGPTVGTLVSTVNGIAAPALNIGPAIRPLADVIVQDAFGVVQYYAFSTNV
jgi:hypothetical protein